ncbi:helix-turn-helix domain-containing protein [uncultured Erythrobacter sp.]|uniref:AraC family transcriptional regulator n=1 Tax=uncultured Erythrobacter sp. TaxID=263913 RepID=UPI0026178646|nr:helix-turn-helix domain-containing protein [uncultured Erythrobacter sp.]
MTKYAYSNDNEPNTSGLSEPDLRALGTIQPAGRTLRSESSQLRPIDKSNEHFSLTYFDPPAGLERHILALFDLQHYEEAWDDRHPGALGQLFFTIQGRAYAYFGDRVDRVDGGPVLFNAFDVAAPYHVDGPWRCLGASLSPFGWASLTHAPVDNCRNRFIPASELLGEDIDFFSDDLVGRCRSGEVSSEQACIEVAEWIRPRLSPIPPTHEDVIEEVLAWLGSSLNPQVDELFGTQPYSRRQIERLVKRYFGFAPRGLARKFRAIRAANLLAQPDLTDEGESEIAMAFTDQPHMIREIRRFCGYTPSRLGGSQDPLFVRLTNMQNLDRFRPYRGLDNGQKPDGPPL